MTEDDLFEDESDWEPVSAEDRVCTAEIFLAWLKDHISSQRRMPMLSDIKKRFGGILGPLIEAHKLKEAGKMPPVPSRKIIDKWWRRGKNLNKSPFLLPLGDPR